MASITSEHPVYTEMAPKWQKMTDVGDASRVRDAKQLYLPKLDGQETNDYNGYHYRALFYNFVGPIIGTFVGAMLRRPAEINYPNPTFLKEMGNGLPFEKYLIDLCTEILKTGYPITYVDAAPNGSAAFPEIISPLTRTNWGKDWHLFKGVEYAPREKDRYVHEKQDRYYLYELKDGTFSVQKRNQEDKPAGAPIYPTDKSGRRLDFIPLVFEKRGIAKPPLYEMAETSLSHYLNSADYEHGAHWTGIPTPYAAGQFDSISAAKAVGGNVPLGPGAFHSGNVGARIGFAEFQGTGLRSILEIMNHKTNHILHLGAAMLNTKSAREETAQATENHQDNRTSPLTMIACNIDIHATETLKTIARIEGYSEQEIRKVSCTLNKRFTARRLDPQILKSLIELDKEEVMSTADLIWLLVNADLKPKEIGPTPKG